MDYGVLLDLAREAELALVADKAYHSPPPTERTYLPEFDYVPSEPPMDQRKKQNSGVAAMGHQHHEQRESLEAMFRRIMASCPPPTRKPKKKGDWENR